MATYYDDLKEMERMLGLFVVKYELDITYKELEQKISEVRRMLDYEIKIIEKAEEEWAKTNALTEEEIDEMAEAYYKDKEELLKDEKK